MRDPAPSSVNQTVSAVVCHEQCPRPAASELITLIVDDHATGYVTDAEGHWSGEVPPRSNVTLAVGGSLDTTMEVIEWDDIQTNKSVELTIYDHARSARYEGVLDAGPHDAGRSPLDGNLHESSVVEQEYLERVWSLGVTLRWNETLLDEVDLAPCVELSSGEVFTTTQEVRPAANGRQAVDLVLTDSEATSFAEAIQTGAEYEVCLEVRSQSIVTEELPVTATLSAKFLGMGQFSVA